MTHGTELQQRELSVRGQFITWYIVHANLCVALGHPLNRANSRHEMAAFTRQLGNTLVDHGALSEEGRDRYWKQAGISEARDVIRDETDRCDRCQQVLVDGLVEA